MTLPSPPRNTGYRMIVRGGSTAILGALLGVTTTVTCADAPPLTIDEAAGCLGLSAQQLADVRAGKVVSTDFRELTDKELAITIALLVDRPIADIADAVRSGKLLEWDPNVIRFKALGDREPADADFADAEFTKGQASEVRKLLAAKPGSEFNLSATEIERFASLRQRFTGPCDRDPACSAAVTEEYRRVLLARLRAYRDRGTDAVAPYAREGGKVASPGEELRTAVHGCDAVQKHLPEVYRAFVEYPRARSEGVESRYFWVEQNVQDRPDFALVHRMLYQRPDAFLGIERQFYVGHSYNSLMIMAGCLPMGSQTLVFYVNRTSTDLVAGFAKDTRHLLGRKRMRAEVIASLEAMRAKFESKAK